MMMAAVAVSTSGCRNTTDLPEAPPVEYRPGKRPAGTLNNLVEQRKGEQGRGIIYHLGNVHHTDEMNETQKQEVGTYQVRIWRALETLRPDAVFAEENAYGDGPIDAITMKESELNVNAGTPDKTDTPKDADKDINVYASLAEKTREMFPRGLLKDASEQQLGWLGTHGAFVAYCAAHPDVPLQAAMSWTEWQDIKPDVQRELAKNNSNVNANNAPACFRGRENLAVKHINAYLAKRPDARVALIYGMRHEFGPALEASGNKSTLLFWYGGPILPSANKKR